VPGGSSQLSRYRVASAASENAEPRPLCDDHGATLVSAQTLPLDWLYVDHAAIQYSTGRLSDPVTELSRKIDEGKVRLEFDP